MSLKTWMGDYEQRRVEKRNAKAEEEHANRCGARSPEPDQSEYVIKVDSTVTCDRPSGHSGGHRSDNERTWT